LIWPARACADPVNAIGEAWAPAEMPRASPLNANPIADTPLELHAMANYSDDFANWFAQVPPPPPSYFNWVGGLEDWLRRAALAGAQFDAAPFTSDAFTNQSPPDHDTNAPAVQIPQTPATATASNTQPGAPSTFATAAARPPVDATGQALKGIGVFEREGIRSRLGLYDRIDRGQSFHPIEDVLDYRLKSPEERQAIRADLQTQLDAPIENDAFYSAGNNVQQFANKHLALTPEQQASWPGWTGNIAGNILTGVGLTGLGALFGQPEAGLLATAGLAGLQATGQTFQEALDKGATEEQAAKAAGISGVVNWGLGSVPLGTALAPVRRFAPGMAGWAATKLAQAAKSGATFAGLGEVQAYLHEQIAKEFYDPKAGYSPDVQRLLVNLAGGSVVGAFGRMGLDEQVLQNEPSNRDVATERIASKQTQADNPAVKDAPTTNIRRALDQWWGPPTPPKKDAFNQTRNENVNQPSSDEQNAADSSSQTGEPQQDQPSANPPILVPYTDRSRTSFADPYLNPNGFDPFAGKRGWQSQLPIDDGFPPNLPPWIAYQARNFRGGSDGGAPGASLQSAFGSGWQQPGSKPSNVWRADNFDEPPPEPRPQEGEISPHSLTPANRQFLWDFLGLRPQDFDGTVRNDNGRIWVSGDLVRNGEPIGQITRSGNENTGTAVHHSIEIAPAWQRHGLSKGILAANIDYYRSHGINLVRTRAGDEGGGFTWARYGFVPEQDSWLQLRGELARRLDQIQGLPENVKGRIQDLLASPDPKTIWEVADYEMPVPERNDPSKMATLGSRLLRGTTWKGYMDLNDPEINRRFDDYVENRPAW
jgi:GNAT superfamily N-acetyltransferase